LTGGNGESRGKAVKIMNTVTWTNTVQVTGEFWEIMTSNFGVVISELGA
jgi:hypothetical protein